MWISLELIYLPELSILQAGYGAVGLALVLLALLPSARSHLHSASVAAALTEGHDHRTRSGQPGS